MTTNGNGVIIDSWLHTDRKKVRSMHKQSILILATVLLLLAALSGILLHNCGGQTPPATDPPTDPPTEHVHHYEAVVTPPSCIQEGITTHTCACGDSYTTDPVELVDHDYQESARTEPTSTQDGSVTYTCSVCGEEDIQVLYATGSEGLYLSTKFDGRGYNAYVGGLGSCTDLDVVIPAQYQGKTVTLIEEEAFLNASSLTSIRIPETVVRIFDRAFAGCSGLTEITLPASVKNIGPNLFQGCTQLHTIYYNTTFVNQNNKFLNIPSLKKMVFGGTCVPYSLLKSYTNVEEVVIRGTVTHIYTAAFANCSSLTTVTFEGITSLEIEPCAFYNCNGLTELSIPEGVTALSDNLLDDCANLAKLTVPASVTSIGNCTIKGCKKLTDIYYSGTKAQWNAIEKHEKWDSYTEQYTVHCTDGDISK